MRWVRHNFAKNYHSFDGATKTTILADELSKAIVMEPDLVGQIFKENNIIVSSLSARSLVKLLIENKENNKMMKEITALVLALNSDHDGATHAFFGKDAAERRANRKENGNKGALFQKIGGFISNNKEAIGGALVGIQGILSNRKEVGQLNANVDHYQKIQVPEIGKQKSMPTWGWVLIGLGSVVMIGTLIFSTRKS